MQGKRIGGIMAVLECTHEGQVLMIESRPKWRPTLSVFLLQWNGEVNRVPAGADEDEIQLCDVRYEKSHRAKRLNGHPHYSNRLHHLHQYSP